jgi:hypothetical protein
MGGDIGNNDCFQAGVNRQKELATSAAPAALQQQITDLNKQVADLTKLSTAGASEELARADED